MVASHENIQCSRMAMLTDSQKAGFSSRRNKGREGGGALLNSKACVICGRVVTTETPTQPPPPPPFPQCPISLCAPLTRRGPR